MGLPRPGTLPMLHILHRTGPPQDGHNAHGAAIHERISRQRRLCADGYGAEVAAVLEEACCECFYRAFCVGMCINLILMTECYV